MTGKFYVGIHSTRNLDDGYLGSGKLIQRSVLKYGAENHLKEILEFLPNREQLKEREKQVVDHKMLNNDMCLNLQPGGGGGLTTTEHAKNFHRAGWLTMSNQVDRVARSAKAQNTMKIRGSARPWGDGFQGRQHTIKTRTRMSVSHLGKHQGEKNSQYGTCWITDGIKPIKIQKQLLNEYLQNGFTRGRKTTAEVFKNSIVDSISTESTN